MIIALIENNVHVKKQKYKGSLATFNKDCYEKLEVIEIKYKPYKNTDFSRSFKPISTNGLMVQEHKNI